MRDLLARFTYWLSGLREEERHRRSTAEALRGLHRPDLTPADQQELAAHAEMVHVWRTGEYPAVAFDHSEPIGPREPMPALYADLLAGSSTWMSQDTLARLEGPTGCWRAEDLNRAVEQFERSR